MYFHLELRGPHAGELSYVLGKHPDRLFEWEVLGSMVRVFFPVHKPDHARACVIFWPDPATVLRHHARQHGPEEHVSPRPYVINSVFCTALKVAFNSAITGNRHAPPEVLGRTHELEVVLAPICTWLSPERIASLFEPLGYEVTLQLEPQKPDLDFNVRHPRLYELTLKGQLRVPEVLRHIFVLAQVIDTDRHEYMDQNDVDRLQRFGGGWLETHPERTFIVSRYLIYRRLIDLYLQHPTRESDHEGGDRADDGYDASGEPIPHRPTLSFQRHQHIAEAILALPDPPQRVVQVSCGDGRLLAELVSRGVLEEVIGTDPSSSNLERARRRVDRAMRYTQALRKHPTRFDLLVSALGYNDPRLHGFDAVVLCDVLEHFDEDRLPFYLAPILEQWTPRMLILAVPNREWGAPPGDRENRHAEIRSEWDRPRFRAFCEGLARGRGYQVQVFGVGPEMPDKGAPTQLGVLTRERGAR